MFYNIKKNSVSNFPNVTVNCNVLCFLNEADKQDESKACYWISYQIQLSECIGMTPQQIDEKVKEKGEELFNRPEMKLIFDAIELGQNVISPEFIEKKKEVIEPVITK